MKTASGFLSPQEKIRQQTFQAFLKARKWAQDPGYSLHTLSDKHSAKFWKSKRNLHPIFPFKGKGLCLQPQPCWLHHLRYQHSHGHLATDLNKHFLFDIKVIYQLWKEPILTTIREEKELAVAVPSSPTCSHDEAGAEHCLFAMHCSLNFLLLLISTTHISEKKHFQVYCTEQFSTTPTWK